MFNIGHACAKHTCVHIWHHALSERSEMLSCVFVCWAGTNGALESQVSNRAGLGCAWLAACWHMNPALDFLNFLCLLCHLCHLCHCQVRHFTGLRRREPSMEGYPSRRPGGKKPPKLAAFESPIYELDHLNSCSLSQSLPKTVTSLFL